MDRGLSEMEGQFWGGKGLMAKEGTYGGSSASCRLFLGPRKEEAAFRATTHPWIATAQARAPRVEVT